MAERLTAGERVRKGIDDFFGSSGPGLEEVVNTKAFGDILAQITGNMVAISRIGGETLDLLIRNARLAGRRDVSELGHQLARNEDKLEAVLALVVELQEELKVARGEAAASAADEPAAAAKKDSASKPTAEQD
ncbi:MAG: hypothetical protein Q4F67_12320 [Propionibacteriaceae bacterium]|nr:hypothetical protein [Propionibacteriaceae bacterium]